MSGAAAGFARSAVDELAAVVERLDPDALERAVEAVLRADRVFFTGSGRSGLMARAVAMRLMHVGLPSYAVGEVATPGIAAGDLLVAFTSSSRGSILEQARTATRYGAEIVLLTADGAGPLAALASATVVLPARTEVPTGQHAGSLFEQSALVVGDALVREVQLRLRVPGSELDERHANLS